MNIMSKIKQRGEEYYEIMQKIYEEAIKLHKENNFGRRRISRIIEEKYGIKIPHATIYGWLYKRRHPLGNCKKLKLCPELAYVMGAWLGDGSLAHGSHAQYIIKLQVEDYEFAEEFGKCAGVINNNPLPYKPYLIRDKYEVRFCNVLLYYLLKHSRKDPWILMPYLKSYPAEACRGFFDAEGSTSFDGKYCYVRVSNDNFELLKMITELLKSLDISSRIYAINTPRKIMVINGRTAHRNKNRTFCLYTSGKESTKKFYEEVEFTIKRKQEELKQAMISLGWI
ncbi:MAG: LAGLIDADG family homing endonuclease [Nitrososphaerota archaeon]